MAISQDERRVVAYAAEMRDALSKAVELGEESPIIFRVPESPAALVLLERGSAPILVRYVRPAECHKSGIPARS